MTLRISLLLFASFGVMPICQADERRIQDNSIFIEEASNQDSGFLQVIQTYQYKQQWDEWTYVIALEAPIQGKNHQISIVVPVSKVRSPEVATGVQDPTLSYRYQAIDTVDLKLAPRAGVVMPVGDVYKGLGSGGLGAELMLPVSVKFSDLWENHWNLRLTHFPNAKNSDDIRSNILSIGYGTGLIYFYNNTFNFLIEALGSQDEVVTTGGSERSSTLFLSPGFRSSFSVNESSEIVFGMGLPMGLGPSQNESSAIFYFSIEGAFL